MLPTPDDFLDRPLLRQLAGEEFFASGQQCFASGRVRQMRSLKDRVSATVSDARPYRVKLWRRHGELRYRCDCEAGRAESFCQHCVAVGLAWLSRTANDAAPAQASASGATDAASEARRNEERRYLSGHLAALEKERLVSLLLEATDYDEILRRRLLLEAIGISRVGGERARRGRSLARPDVPVYKRLLSEAIHPAGFVDYHAMSDYVQGIEEAIRPLGDLLRDEWNDEVIELTEFVLLELDAAGSQVDIGDTLLDKTYETLQRIHYDACFAAKPDRKALAARLLHYELEGGLGVFNNAVKTYAEVLGREGIAAWRVLLTGEWNAQNLAIRAVDASEPQGPKLVDYRRFQTRMLLERMAQAEDDPESLLAIKKSDLAGVHDHVALAEFYDERGRLEEAIRCVEKALGRFAGMQERMILNDFLIGACLRAGKADRARSLAWEQFTASSDLERFRELKKVVTAFDASDWPTWRDRALASARAKAPPAATDQSGMVELLLEENLLDAAWETASEAGCRDDLWLVLASQREAAHPAEALPVYQRLIDAILKSGGQNAYRDAVGKLRHVSALFQRLDRLHQRATYLRAVRAAHRHRRTFLRLLDAAGL